MRVDGYPSAAVFQRARSAAQMRTNAMPVTAAAGGMWEFRVHGVELSHYYYSSYASYVANLVFVVVVVRITQKRMSRRGMGGSGRVGARRGGGGGGGGGVGQERRRGRSV